MSKQELEQKNAVVDQESIALSELIRQQGVSPVHNLDALSDLWPVDDDPDLLFQFILQERTERRQLDTDKELVE